MIESKKIECHQATFWPAYTSEERIKMVERDLEKTRNCLGGLFKRCGEVKEQVDFLEAVLEDLAMETISMC
jgi:archaellum component FlaC